MLRTTVKIDGMACGMCEAHIADTVRKLYPDARKVSASHKTGEATFLTEEAPREDALKRAIEETGYTCVSVTTEPYEKKRFWKGRFFQ